MYRARRRALLISVQEVAKTLGVAYSAVSNWELGHTTPSAENAERYRALIDSLTANIQAQDPNRSFNTPFPAVIPKDPSKTIPAKPEGVKVCMVCNRCQNQVGLVFVSHSTGCKGYGCQCPSGGVACSACGAIDSSETWKALGNSVLESNTIKPR